jgi:hypothetical protein
LGKKKERQAMAPLKLQNNRDWVEEWENKNEERLSTVALVYARIDTPRGGREHRPLPRFGPKEKACIAGLDLFVARPHVRYPKYRQIDPKRCTIDYEDGTASLPVTFM